MGRNAIRIGLLGIGTVGAGVVKILTRSLPELEKKAGTKLELARVAE